ncbi:MAG TPA: hypothetical protein VGJ25_01700 [Gaiellaceae bacterium]
MTLEELQAGAGTEFLFHYTDAVRADAIIEERCFVSGPRTAHGFGIYATDIAPVGAETIDEVIVNCFRGDATPPEVNHAIVVRRSSGRLRFERTDDPYQWVLPTGKLELVFIEGIYVAAIAFSGSRWEIINVED